MIYMIPIGWRETVVYQGAVAHNVTSAGGGTHALILDGVEVLDSELDAWYCEDTLFDPGSAAGRRPGHGIQGLNCGNV